MTIRKASLPAFLVPATIFLAGCFDMGQDSSPGGSKPLATAALSGNEVAVCNPCGQRPAFISTPDPAKPHGWSLDSTAPVPGGYAIRHVYYNTSTSSIAVTTRTGGLIDLDVRGDAELWGVNHVGDVFRNNNPAEDNSSWSDVPIYSIRAKRIGTGSSGVFILAWDVVAGGNSIYKWTGAMTGNPWQLVSGGLVDLDVDNNGDLWGVNNEGKVFRLPGGDPSAAWELKSPAIDAQNISCGNGKIYVRNSSDHVLHLVSGSWINQTNGFREIQVDAAGRLWAGHIGNGINTWTGI